MNSQKVEAWFMFLLGLSCFLIPGAATIFIAYDRGMSFAPLFGFTGLMIWGGLFWLLPFISKKVCRGKGKISFDERDQLIHKRAVTAAYVVLWLYFVAVSVIPWWIVGPHGCISVNVMPIALLGGLATFLIVQGLATLILYRFGIKRGGDGRQ